MGTSSSVDPGSIIVGRGVVGMEVSGRGVAQETLDHTVEFALSTSAQSPGGCSMHQSRLIYFADFIVYPIVVVTLLLTSITTATSLFAWFFTCLAGLAAWALVEYLIHCFVFHLVPMFLRMHSDHHANPSALIGAPFWLSLIPFGVGVFAPIWWQVGLSFAASFTAGLTGGYLCYMFVHHAVHHWTIDETSWLYAAWRRHLLHNYRLQEQNFGVTTGFLDRIFGMVSTKRPVRRRPVV